MARFIFAFILSMVSVAAVGAETIDLGPSDWRKWDSRTSNHTLEGLRSSYGQPVRMGPSGGSLNVTRNPVVPYGSIGNGLRGLARSSPGAIAASAAMSALFYGMDWLFEDGAWVKMDVVDMPPDSAISFWVGSGGWNTSSYGHSWSSASAACAGLVGVHQGAENSTWSNGRVSYRSGTYYCQGDRNGIPDSALIGAVVNSNPTCPEGFEYNVNLGGCFGNLPVPLTDSDYSELTAKLPTVSPGTVGGAAGDLMNRQGAPLPGFSDTDISGPSSVTGPSTTTTSSGPAGTETAISTTTTNISYGPTTITTTNTTTTNTYTNGEPSGTTTTTETPSPDLVTEPPPSPGGSTSLDIPTDCEFMPTVCAFLDWFKEPVPMPEPDLPVVVDHDFEREYEMNLTAECPPPYTVDTQLFGTLSISWQPFCDLATLIKPLVVGSAFLLSAFITLGIGRGKS